MADTHAVTPRWIRPIARALDAAGWGGAVEVEADEAGHVHVRWNGRHVEAVSVEAAALFIEADTRARAAALTPDAEADCD